MRPVLFAAALLLAPALASPAQARQGTPDQVTSQIGGACQGWSDRKYACGVAIYVPADCTIANKRPVIRKVFRAYKDGTAHIQSGGYYPMVNLSDIAKPMDISDGRGGRNHYGLQSFLSLNDHKAARSSVMVCGHDVAVDVTEYEIPQGAVSTLRYSIP